MRQRSISPDRLFFEVRVLQGQAKEIFPTFCAGPEHGAFRKLDFWIIGDIQVGILLKVEPGLGIVVSPSCRIQDQFQTPFGIDQLGTCCQLLEEKRQPSTGSARPAQLTVQQLSTPPREQEIKRALLVMKVPNNFVFCQALPKLDDQWSKISAPVGYSFDHHRPNTG